MTTMVSSRAVGQHAPLGERHDVLVVDVVEGDVAQPVQRRVLAPDLVDPGEVPGEGLALLDPARLVVLPVAVLVLVLLVVDLLLGAGPGDVLDELVAGVDAVGRDQRRGEGGPQLPGGRAAELHVGREDVVRRRPERRAHVGRGLAGELLDVLGELPLGVAPGVVGVGLLEPDLAERVHHRRLGERLGQPDHLGVVAGDVVDEPLPELDRLGVRVVDAEDLDAVVDPDLDHPPHLGVGADRVVVEVQRVDVLVLLGRVLGVGDGAVGAGGEPLGVGLDVGVVGGALQRDVHRHLEPELLGLRRRSSRSRRSRRGRGGSRRARRRGSRWRRGCPGRRGRRRGCCWGPCGRSCRSGGSGSGRRRRSPSAAIAGSRLAAVRSVPVVHFPVSGSCTAPSERGKISYHAPYRARSRSTSSGYAVDGLT